MMVRINFKLPEGLLRECKELVEAGHFTSLQELFRTAIKELVEGETCSRKNT